MCPKFATKCTFYSQLIPYPLRERQRKSEVDNNCRAQYCGVYNIYIAKSFSIWRSACERARDLLRLASDSLEIEKRPLSKGLLVADNLFRSRPSGCSFSLSLSHPAAALERILARREAVAVVVVVEPSGHLILPLMLPSSSFSLSTPGAFTLLLRLGRTSV